MVAKYWFILRLILCGQNQIFIFDLDGKQKDKIDIGVSAFPRYFNFDEINQKYNLVFKGFKQNQIECFDSDLIIVNIDGTLKKENWKQTLKLKGTFVDIFMVNQYFFLVTNFNFYQI